MSDVVIRAEGLGKRYLIGHETGREGYVALRDVIARSARNLVRSANDMMRGRQLVVGDEIEEFWALKDINFEIRRGEVVGIIGRNGAGKSTLLKILSRITEPSTGRVEIRGRVASLLEVGTGFHPELTGRENIFLNGAILGMTRAEIQRKFDEIVAFAEVEKFLDTPVKRYSSGMYVRLAFAVAAHLEPEILIVDEVLAVDDAEFQKKCLGKMKDVAAGGRTVLFVSHSIPSISTLCSEAIYLRDGKIRCRDSVDRAVKQYAEERTSARIRSPLLINGGIEIIGLEVSPERIQGGGDLALRAQMTVRGELKEFAFLVFSSQGVRVAVLDGRRSGQLPLDRTHGVTSICAHLRHVRLVPGRYSIGIYVRTDEVSGDELDIAEIFVGESVADPDRVSYHPAVRGIVELEYAISLSKDCVGRS